MINEKKTREPSPNAHLGPSGMARRMPEAGPSEGRRAPDHATPAKPKRASLGAIRAAKAGGATRKKPPITLATSAAPIVDEIAEKPRESAPSSPAPKKGPASSSPKKGKAAGRRGRPSSGGRKEPWKEAGRSKSAYYRQMKEEGAK